MSSHSHNSDARSKEVMEGMQKMREKAIETTDPPRRIIRSIIAKMSITSAAEMPSYESIAKNIRRTRNRANVIPKAPEELATKEAKSTHAFSKAEPKLQPNRVMMDFEQAAMKAIEEIFPAVEVDGCLFHFCQCLYRKIQDCELQKSYNEDPIFALKIRCFAALAFVPEADVVKSFDALKKSLALKMASMTSRMQGK
ncbi:hypothetical protein Bhyg_12731 [Pseudolycoriella hygida]|uniref:MULE transposase domain-containing protein n=1 Tax=Pseudolycoriella hygida TaxID=35572 RepID=A0A9Q0MY13_9DIPT|nr:hypothetical protein Bhyg_12731 [Pseudolycoriella hygida]